MLVQLAYVETAQIGAFIDRVIKTYANAVRSLANQKFECLECQNTVMMRWCKNICNIWLVELGNTFKSTARIVTIIYIVSLCIDTNCDATRYMPNSNPSIKDLVFQERLEYDVLIRTAEWQ